MALFRRMKSPRDRHHVTTPTTPTTPCTTTGGGSGALAPVANEEKETNLVSGHRRHKSEDHIVVAVDPVVFENDLPPELPPRNRSDSSGGGGSFTFGTTGSSYRRTQSSGTTTTMSASFKTPGHAARKPQEDYFVPADTLRHLANNPCLSSSPKTSSHEKRLMSMHDKIVSHNAPDFRASQKTRSTSFEKLVDTSDYSVPFDVLQEYEKGNTPVSIPPPKPKRTPVHKSVKETSDLTGGTDPPNYLPPPPPPQNETEEDVNPLESERRNTMSPSGPGSGSPKSPSISVTRGGDYDDPWDSTKFKRIRAKTDTGSSSDLQPINKSNLGSSSSSTHNIDPYKSPKGSNSELSSSETEPPLPPKHTPSPPVHTHSDHHSHHHNSFSSSPSAPRHHSSPPPPPVPESSRPRACTGESDYCEPADSFFHEVNSAYKGNKGFYVNYPSSVVHEGDEGGYMHDYVNQPACPPKLPPRPKKKHAYPPLEPTDVSSHSADINQQQPLLPPAFPIDASIVLEEQPWYHGRIGRDQAEDILRNQPDFSFLVRNSESCRMDYSLSIRDSTSPAAHGFIHLKISSGVKGFVLGEFSNPFRSVPECISFYTQKPLTIKNIHHRRLGFPVGRIQFTHH